jgi:uncharacterized protein YbjT (DUF2867 family)
MIVVTGATGNVGGSLLRALSAAGEKVTAVSRHAPGGDLPAGARHVPADLADPASLEPALRGAEAFFLLVAGEMLGSDQDPRTILDVAAAAGVGRTVLLSSQAAGTRPQAPSHARLRAFEDAVRASGPDWTILRAGGFASNALAWSPSVRAQRMVAAPFGDVGLPLVDPADIAGVAAAVLGERRDDRHAGKTYELTGPALITPREQARAIGAALAEPVTFTELSRDAARQFLTRFMPGPVADGTLEILGNPLPAEQLISLDAGYVLGRPPRAFADWAARHVAAFR